MFVRTLDTHPQIRCLGEVFTNRFPNRVPDSYQEYIRRSFSSRIKHIFSTEQSILEYLVEIESKPANLFPDDTDRAQCRRVGFKLMLADANRAPKVLEYAKTNGVQLIHLVRKNSLDIVVSIMRNRITKIPHVRTDESAYKNFKPPKVTLNTNKLIEEIDKIELSKCKWLELLRDTSYTTIYYDKIVHNRETEYQQIMRGLGVEDSAALETPLRKIGLPNLFQSINNYEQVVRCLSGSAYEKYLHD
jgi:hypothetical protein